MFLGTHFSIPLALLSYPKLFPSQKPHSSSDGTNQECGESSIISLTSTEPSNLLMLSLLSHYVLDKEPKNNWHTTSRGGAVRHTRSWIHTIPSSSTTHSGSNWGPTSTNLNSPKHHPRRVFRLNRGFRKNPGYLAKCKCIMEDSKQINKRHGYAFNRIRWFFHWTAPPRKPHCRRRRRWCLFD